MQASDDGPEAWRQDAACRDDDVADWFPTRSVSSLYDNAAHIRSLKQVCARCPVLQECRTYALNMVGRDQFGVWGGLTPVERARLRRTLGIRRASRLRGGRS